MTARTDRRIIPRMKSEGYLPDPLFESDADAERFGADLGLATVGCRVLYVGSTASTNEDLKALAHDGAGGGTVLITDHQSAGRGRKGRRWHSPPGSGLLLSYLLKPDLEARLAAWLTGTAALGAASGIAAATGLDMRIKWPNDIVVGGKKLGGVLAESETSDGTLRTAVSYEEGPGPYSTSISAELGRAANRRDILAGVLRGIDSRVTMLRRGEGAALAAELTSVCTNVGRHIGPQDGPGGVVECVDALCRLLVRAGDGRTITVPLAWYPRLLGATPAQREKWEVCGGGFGIHWPEVDEDLSTQGLLVGSPAPRLHDRV